MKRPDAQIPDVLRTLGYEASDINDIELEIGYWPGNSSTNVEPNMVYINLDGPFLKVYLEFTQTLDAIQDGVYTVTGEINLNDGCKLMLHLIENEIDPIWVETSVKNGRQYVHLPLH